MWSKIRPKILKYRKAYLIVGGFITFILSFEGVFQIITNTTHNNLQGSWKITCYIDESSYSTYIGLSAGYKTFIIKKKLEISGNGEKSWVSDKEIPHSQHTPLTFSGHIKGKWLYISFQEEGERRRTTGEFKVKKLNKNKYVGTFYSTAANSSGRCEMVKL